MITQLDQKNWSLYNFNNKWIFHIKVVEKLKLFCKINKSIINEVIIKIPV